MPAAHSEISPHPKGRESQTDPELELKIIINVNMSADSGYAVT